MRKIAEKGSEQSILCEDTAQIIEMYKDMVYRIVLIRVKNTWDADDVFQEVFLTYFRKRPEFREEQHRKAWIIRTTLNLTKKFVGSTWKKRVVVTDVIEESALPFVFEEEEETRTFQAIKKLPEKYQTVLYLYYFEEMSTREIATFLSVREGTVRMRLLRAREKMGELFRRESPYE